VSLCVYLLYILVYWFVVCKCLWVRCCTLGRPFAVELINAHRVKVTDDDILRLQQVSKLLLTRVTCVVLSTHLLSTICHILQVICMVYACVWLLLVCVCVSVAN
jgi:hypothetical protein